MTSVPASAHRVDNAALYLQCVELAQRDGPLLIEKLLDYARYHLQRQEFELRDPADRRSVAQALVRLRETQRPMIEAFGGAAQGIDNARSEGAPVRRRALTELRFDELELLDAGQVQDHVEVARAQQMTLNHAEASLSELTPLICSVMGLRGVQPERNPLHPQVYLRVLQEVMTATGATPGMRMLWMTQVCNPLGRELEAALHPPLCAPARTWRATCEFCRRGCAGRAFCGLSFQQRPVAGSGRVRHRFGQTGGTCRGSCCSDGREPS